jgi:hypothetical protein
MINLLANGYTIRAVGDHSENVERAIKHGTISLRRTEEIAALKPTTDYSTYRLVWISSGFGCPILDLLHDALSSDSFLTWRGLGLG